MWDNPGSQNPKPSTPNTHKAESVGYHIGLLHKTQRDYQKKVDAGFETLGDKQACGVRQNGLVKALAFTCLQAQAGVWLRMRIVQGWESLEGAFAGHANPKAQTPIKRTSASYSNPAWI